MTSIASSISHYEENAAECRENLHNYDLAFTHLAGYLSAVVDCDRAPSVEIAKAELAFAIARLKFITGEVIWKNTEVNFNEELQLLINLAQKHGIDSGTEHRTIEGMFSTITYWAGYLTATLKKFPQYKGE